jgi:hypothetical protein
MYFFYNYLNIKNMENMNNNEKTIEKTEKKESKDENINLESKTEKGCCGIKHGFHGSRFLKIFIAIALALFIFAIIGAFSHFGRFAGRGDFKKSGYSRGQNKMMVSNGTFTKGTMMQGVQGFATGGIIGTDSNEELFNCPMMGGIKGGNELNSNCPMMGGIKGGNCMFKGANMMFGAITKIEGNKITVLDNSNLEQILITQATTTIMSTLKEIGIKDLKEAQNINFVGQLNKDNQYEVSWIKVL